ncbi:hypothetical protein OIU77_005414 [Salix suchowensis]|uniref:Uncharacterized protein n=1 Tax=Salix suchowensis TaxID=1278906 RepID=A0ABQ9ARF6_9ROSI|nr:hypothetical protein OIU77_005414 [Salix suchowensis]
MIAPLQVLVYHLFTLDFLFLPSWLMLFISDLCPSSKVKGKSQTFPRYSGITNAIHKLLCLTETPSCFQP